MSDISFFSRLNNLWKGFVSIWISDVEKAHPEIAYQNSIDSMIGKYEKLKNATAAIIRRRQDLENRLQHDTRELESVTADLEAAIETKQDDLAIVLIQKKDILDKSIQTIQIDLAQAQKDADSAKDSLVQVKTEIGKLKAEKDRMLAQMQSASARIKIQDQLEGLSVDAEVKALDNVREHIQNTVARANLGAEIAESDVDNRLAKLRNTSGAITAKSKLEAMKRAREAKAADATKSM